MDLGKIKSLAENRVGGIRKLALDIGMSEANLHRCIKHNKIQAGDLETIANLCGVSISIFFTHDVKWGSAEIEQYRADGGVAARTIGHLETHAAPVSGAGSSGASGSSGAIADLASENDTLRRDNERLKTELLNAQSMLIDALRAQQNLK